MTQFLLSLSLGQAIGLAFFGMILLSGSLVVIAGEVDDLLAKHRLSRMAFRYDSADEFEYRDDI